MELAIACHPNEIVEADECARNARVGAHSLHRRREHVERRKQRQCAENRKGRCQHQDAQVPLPPALARRPQPDSDPDGHSQLSRRPILHFRSPAPTGKLTETVSPLADHTGAESDGPAPVAIGVATAYLASIIFWMFACAVFRASSGLSVPATALESSIPSAFSISGHLGWRGRGVEASMAAINSG